MFNSNILADLFEIVIVLSLTVAVVCAVLN